MVDESPGALYYGVWMPDSFTEQRVGGNEVKRKDHEAKAQVAQLVLWCRSSSVVVGVAQLCWTLRDPHGL